MASRYRVSRRSLSFLTVLILGTLQLQAVMAGNAAAQNNACNGAFSGNPSGPSPSRRARRTAPP